MRDRFASLRMPSDRYPAVSVSADPHPTDAPFGFGVERLRDFAPDSPALIRVWFENRSGTDQTVGFGPIRPFSCVWSEGDGRLVLLPTDAAVRARAFGADGEILPDRPVDGCWQTNAVRFVRHDVLRWRSLAPGQRVRADYAVLHYPERAILEATGGTRVEPERDSDDCLPAGTYRFEDRFPPKPTTGATWREFAWGFSLSVAE